MVNLARAFGKIDGKASARRLIARPLAWLLSQNPECSNPRMTDFRLLAVVFRLNPSYVILRRILIRKQKWSVSEW